MPSEQPGIDNPTDDQPIQEPNTHQGVNTGFDGLLIIGDPHIEGRQPNFRKDNYPEKILDKLEFCLEHCRKHNLQPVCLGDLFDKPRDNAISHADDWNLRQSRLPRSGAEQTRYALLAD